MKLGTPIVYYGDEIGMTGHLDDLSKDNTTDPYVDVNCEPNDKTCYLTKSRDPMRTPMQVCNYQFISIIFFSAQYVVYVLSQCPITYF